MIARDLLCMAYALGNASAYDLIEAGVLRADATGEPSTGGSDWSRFNSDLITFIMKLPEDRLEALARFVDMRAPVSAEAGASGGGYDPMIGD